MSDWRSQTFAGPIGRQPVGVAQIGAEVMKQPRLGFFRLREMTRAVHFMQRPDLGGEVIYDETTGSEAPAKGSGHMPNIRIFAVCGELDGLRRDHQGIPGCSTIHSHGAANGCSHRCFENHGLCRWSRFALDSQAAGMMRVSAAAGGCGPAFGRSGQQGRLRMGKTRWRPGSAMVEADVRRGQGTYALWLRTHPLGGLSQLGEEEKKKKVRQRSDLQAVYSAHPNITVSPRSDSSPPSQRPSSSESPLGTRLPLVPALAPSAILRPPTLRATAAHPCSPSPYPYIYIQSRKLRPQLQFPPSTTLQIAALYPWCSPIPSLSSHSPPYFLPATQRRLDAGRLSHRTTPGRVLIGESKH
ncbi:hypothetical protein CC78DRAFT_573525 [Lojkania enalia]|uniref:Uncharacterized protein n=1 Tax=Lojkania enalia TaxID=147567 RepID=A0A9P4TRZ4_9PLEO|nr:hypothetical protein CC78DRAFT_573525 [Didymosphaeria enalia]